MSCMEIFLSSVIIHLLSFQVLKQVRMTTDANIERNVELFLPILFEKLSDNSMFILCKIIFKLK